MMDWTDTSKFAMPFQQLMESARWLAALKSHPEFHVESSDYCLARRTSRLSKKLSASSGSGHHWEQTGWIQSGRIVVWPKAEG
jgi:hypothetical protein